MADLITHLPGILVALAVAVFFHIRRRKQQSSNNNNNQKNPVPEVAGALPIIGHLHLLRGNQPFARKLASFSDKYGAVFAIRLGSQPVVVVSDHLTMKECFTTNDRVLAFRPDSTQAKIIGYNYAVIGFASYGDYFRDMKKILTTEVFSVHRVNALRDVRVSEVDFLVAGLYKQIKAAAGGEVISMSEALHRYTLNVMARVVAGKRYFDKADSGEGENFSGGRPIGEVIREFMLIVGMLVPADLIPVLGWVGSRGPVNAMKRVFKELDAIIQSWVDEHKRKGVAGDGDGDSKRDIIDVMLSVIKNDVAYGHKRETIVKATAQALILGGSDTTEIVLTWILSNLLNHKQALKLAQDEIDDKVGRHRWVNESDIENLTYVRAVIKETLRMYPPGPISLPRVASQDITIKGYHVAKGTQVFANFWKLHRDPKVWSDPDEFKPERFLANVEISKQQFEYLPFGSGRRGCPGIDFGMQVTQLTLARLLQGFDWGTPENKPVDMAEGLEFVLGKAKPLEVVLAPRLSPQFYKQNL